MRKYVKLLEEKGLIATERSVVTARDGRHMNGSLLYNIRPFREAIALFHEWQTAGVDCKTERKSRIKPWNCQRLPGLPTNAWQAEPQRAPWQNLLLHDGRQSERI